MIRKDMPQAGVYEQNELDPGVARERTRKACIACDLARARAHNQARLNLALVKARQERKFRPPQNAAKTPTVLSDTK